MRRIAAYVLSSFAVAGIVCSCGCFNGFPSRTSDNEVRIAEHVTMATVNPTFEILPMTEIRCGVTDSMDIIENDYAVSSVCINQDGSYDHRLSSKPQIISDTLSVPVVSRDSSYVSTTVQQQYIDKPITGWRLALMVFGGMCLAIMLVVLAVTMASLFNRKSNNNQ